MSIEIDREALTVTVTADFPVPPQRVWDVFADIRQLERIAGALDRPAVYTRNDFRVGGRAAFWQPLSDGSTLEGRWEWARIEPPQLWESIDENFDEFGEQSRDVPATRIVGTNTPTPDGTRFAMVHHFLSTAALDAAVESGMTTRIAHTADRIAEVIADPDGPGLPPTAMAISDTMIRICGYLDVSVEEAWRAHQDAELLMAWMLGPDGWTMPVVEVASLPGERYRYEWEDPATGERRGYQGEVVEAVAPYRMVVTQRPLHGTADGFISDVTYVAVAGGTVLTQLIHCPNREQRDELLSTGVAHGFAQAYRRLEATIRAEQS